MIIVLATDNKFIEHCAVTIISVATHNRDVTFYILTEFLTPKNENTLHKIGESTDSKIVIIKINFDLLKKFPMPNTEELSHISLATYYRLLISSLLPKTVDKAIYLDCDIIVRKNISELWNEDISEFALAAVYQVAEENANSITRLQYPLEYGYFNAGVLLLNLDYWRKNKIEEKIFNFIINNYERIIYHDQDTLNAVLHFKVKEISCKWNMLSSYFKNDVHRIIYMNKLGHVKSSNSNYSVDILNEIRSPSIVHFVSRPKPWSRHCYHPYMFEYYKYLSQHKGKWCIPNVFDLIISIIVLVIIKLRFLTLWIKLFNGKQ